MKDDFRSSDNRDELADIGIFPADRMTSKEHIQRHKELHKSLDELLADFMGATKESPFFLTRPIEDLIEWSYQQTLKPDHAP